MSYNGFLKLKVRINTRHSQGKLRVKVRVQHGLEHIILLGTLYNEPYQKKRCRVFHRVHNADTFNAKVL